MHLLGLFTFQIVLMNITFIKTNKNTTKQFYKTPCKQLQQDENKNNIKFYRYTGQNDL